MHRFTSRRRRKNLNRSLPLTRAAHTAIEQLESRTLLTADYVAYAGPYLPVPGVEGAAPENGGVINYELRRSSDDLSQPLTVNLTVTGVGDHPATADEDFTAPSTATFAANDEYAYIQITVIDDDLPEPEESLLLTVAPGSGYDVDPAAASPPGEPAVIEESDVPTVWAQPDTSTPDAATATEAGDNATLLLKRDNTHGDLTVRYQLFGDWGPDGASASPDDYSIAAQTPDENGIYQATFPDGQDTISLQVQATDDHYAEPNREGFEVFLDDPAAGYEAVAGDDKYYTGDGTENRPIFAPGIIQDNDYDLSISNNDSAIEGQDGVAGFNINRYGDLRQPLTVNFNMSGAATLGEDYDSSPFDAGQVTFAPGQSDAWLPLTPTDDETPEWTEDVILTLQPADNINLYGDAFATDHIKDNDLSFNLQQGTLAANYGDQNNDGITDYEETVGGSGGDKLYEMDLIAPREHKDGTSVTLHIPDDFFNVYLSTSKGSPVEQDSPGSGNYTWYNGDGIPQSLYLEVKKGSQAVDDITCELSSNDNGNGPPPFSQQNTAVNFEIDSLSDPNNDGGGDIKNKQRPWLVGQMVDQYLYVQCPSAWLQNVAYEWTVPGSILQDYIQTNGSAHTVPVSDTVGGPNGASTGYHYAEITFFWVSTASTTTPDNNTVSVVVSGVNGNSYTVSSDYQVYSPSSTATATMGTGGIDPGTNEVGLVLPPPAEVGGINWHGSVTTPSAFASGAWNFLQTVQLNRHLSDSSWNSYHFSLNGLWGLDGSIAYGAMSSDPFNSGDAWTADGTSHSTNDSPSITINNSDNQYTMDDHFYTFLMYRPPGSNARWVPLRVIGWNYYVWAKKVNGTLTVPSATQSMDQANGVFRRETNEPIWNNLITTGPGTGWDPD